MTPQVLRYTAFSQDPASGNPAGVVLDAAGLDEQTMQTIAADVGYSETAFLFPGRRSADGSVPVRYFSPKAEVPFCGHATIATAVAWAERNGFDTLTLATQAGLVPVALAEAGGMITATLTSVEPRSQSLPDELLDSLLAALRYSHDDLEPTIEPGLAYAGAWHPVIAVRSRSLLAALDYDYEALAALMAEHDWTTVAVLWRESATVLHARNPFPPGGVVEDPATGAAAAAVGAHLRARGLIETPTTITIHQGDDMGRPSLLAVTVGTSGGIQVSGTATAMS